MKTIEISMVKFISLIEVDNKQRILLTLNNNTSFYANGDIDIVKDVYYCHYHFTIWSNI